MALLPELLAPDSQTPIQQVLQLLLTNTENGEAAAHAQFMNEVPIPASTQV